MKHINAKQIVCLILATALLVGVGGCLGNLGPLGTPDVTKKKWKSLEMNYGFVRGEGDRRKGDFVERSFVISGADLDSLQRRFNPANIRGMSTGSYAKSKLTLENGEVWLFMVITPQNMRVCLESNRKLHYAVKFDDLQFYDALRELCWKNELAITPDVKIENIFLGYNGVHTHRVERPFVQPYRGEAEQADEEAEQLISENIKPQEPEMEEKQ